MRSAAAVSLAALAAAPPIFQSPDHKATVLLSTVKAGAERVALTVRLQTVLRCGRPTGAAVVVTLPRAARLPHAIAAASVRVNGKAPARVAVAGRSVTVGLPIVHGITCNSLTAGTLQVAFAPAAALGNPAAAGTYAIAIRQGQSARTVSIAIQA